MALVTIPRTLAQKGDLVVITRKEYEEFLDMRTLLQAVKPVAAELRAINRGRKDAVRKRYVAWPLKT